MIFKNNCIKLGTNYGGWYLPSDIELDENSVIYSGGVGEDISFDLILSDKYNSNIYLIDPTKRSVKHFEEIKQFYKTKKFKFSGNIQPDYNKTIKNLNPKFDTMYYINIGIWDKDDTLKFFKPTNRKYVSHSLIEGMASNKYEEINVTSIKSLMEKNNHTHIDLLKLDIEGAEIKVIKQMLEDKIYPSYLLIEFDLFLKGKDKSETENLIKKLRTYYDIVKNDQWNITFKLNS